MNYTTRPKLVKVTSIELRNLPNLVEEKTNHQLHIIRHSRCVHLLLHFGEFGARELVKTAKEIERFKCLWDYISFYSWSVPAGCPCLEVRVILSYSPPILRRWRSSKSWMRSVWMLLVNILCYTPWFLLPQNGQQTFLSVLYSSVRQWSFVEKKLGSDLTDNELVCVSFLKFFSQFFSFSNVFFHA